MSDAWRVTTAHPAVLTDADGRVLAAQRRLWPPVRRSRISDLPTEPVEDLIIASRYRAAYRAARRLTLTESPASLDWPPSQFVAIDGEGGEFPAHLSFVRTNDEPPHGSSPGSGIRPRIGRT